MKLKIFILLMLALQAFYANAQCNEKTKEQLDSLKSSIPYPKFNIDDVLYIAFINAPDVSTDNVTKEDINVMKVRIFDMRAYNSIGGSQFDNILSLNGTFPVKWEYQFIDTSIKAPKYKDVSCFYPEDRFSTTVIGAEQTLMKR